MRKSKIISVFMVAVMVASAIPMPAFAASVGSSSTDISVGADTKQNAQTQYTEIAESDTQTQVYLSVDESDLIVSLPTTIILSGTPNEKGQYIGNYSVGVKGEMSGDKVVNIEPESTTIALHQKGKLDSEATISQEQTTFDTDDFKTKTTTTGTVTAERLSAGSWNSDFNFNITLNTTSNDAFNGYSILYRYDLSATKTDNVAAYYCVPNKNTEKITINKQNESQTNNYSVQTTSNTSTQSNNKIIEANGIKYTLSDDDTLVISGSGNMKENIQQDLCGYDALQKDVSEHFGKENIYEDVNGDITTPGKENTTYFLWSINDIEPLYATFTSNNGYSTKPVETEVKNYIDTIKDKYMFNLPKTLIVQNGVTNISNLAFYNCTSLSNVTISDSVTSIGLGAFAGCTNLININIPDNVTSIGISAFSECTNLKNIKLPTKLKKISGDMLGGCKSLTNIEIPNSVISIDSYAFNYCTSLTSITIPNSVTSIGENTFYYCTSLTNVTMSDSVTSIDEMAFADCTNLTSITLSNSLTSISYGLFDSCTSLTNVTIPNGVTSIGDLTFKGCTSLTSVAIPDSVTSIGHYIFDYTSSSLVIYCQTQAVADFLKETLSGSWNIVVDATKF